jgi:hypothetical protein
MIARFRAVLGGILLGGLCVSSTPIEAQTFASTTRGPIGSIDPVWKVAVQLAVRDAGYAAFGGTFGDAYHYADYPLYSPVYPFFFSVTGPGTLAFISNTPSGSNETAPSMTFRQRFDLTGYDPRTAVLQFRWACDDVPSPFGAVPWVPVFSLNGGALQGEGTCGGYALGSTVTLTSGFVEGENYMDFFVQGNSITDGFSLETVSFMADRIDVPEPGTASLVAAGLSLLCAVGYRRRRGTN